MLAPRLLEQRAQTADIARDCGEALILPGSGALLGASLFGSLPGCPQYGDGITGRFAQPLSERPKPGSCLLGPVRGLSRLPVRRVRNFGPCRVKVAGVRFKCLSVRPRGLGDLPIQTQPMRRLDEHVAVLLKLPHQALERRFDFLGPFPGESTILGIRLVNQFRDPPRFPLPSLQDGVASLC